MLISRRALLAGAAAGTPAFSKAMALPGWTPPPPDREWRVPVAGGRLYVRVNGNLTSRRAPVIVIHGGPGASHAYLIAALQLADERAVILYDQLDSGLSDHPDDHRNWTVERFVSELEAIRAALDLPRVHVVGHSWGSVIALEHAARHPADTVSLTLGSPFISSRSWEASLRTRLAKLPPAFRDAILRHDAGQPFDADLHRDAIALFNRTFVARHPEPAYVTAYRRRIGAADNDALAESFFGPGDIAVGGALQSYDGEPLLSRLAMPTLLMCGEYDEMTPAAVMRLSRRVASPYLMTIADAGHLIPLDQPDLFVATLRAHLRRAEL